MKAILSRGVIIASMVLSSGSALAEGVTLTEADMDSVTAGSLGSNFPQGLIHSFPLILGFLKFYQLHGIFGNMAMAVDSENESTATAVAAASGMWTYFSAYADVSNGLVVSSSVSSSSASQ